MTPNLFLIKPDDVENLWFGAKPLIQKALDHAEGALTTTDALRLVLTGRMQLWLGFHNNEVFVAVLTEIITYPRHKVCRIITTATQTGHDFDEWSPTMYKHVEDYALSQGCAAFEAWVRKGLVRKLKDWDHEYSVIYKVIKRNEVL
jgi:hypothetical protein